MMVGEPVFALLGRAAEFTVLRQDQSASRSGFRELRLTSYLLLEGECRRRSRRQSSAAARRWRELTLLQPCSAV